MWKQNTQLDKQQREWRKKSQRQRQTMTRRAAESEKSQPSQHWPWWKQKQKTTKTHPLVVSAWGGTGTLESDTHQKSGMIREQVDCRDGAGLGRHGRANKKDNKQGGTWNKRLRRWNCVMDGDMNCSDSSRANDGLLDGR